MAFTLRKCAHCQHQRHIDIRSIKNVFCSYWTEVQNRNSICSKFKSIINPTYLKEVGRNPPL